MYQDDYYNPADQNDYDEDHEKLLEQTKRQDKGYNVIYRRAYRKNGKKYNKKIEVYTSSGTGNHIRDAETGDYLNYLVGSKDEDLFFKVMLGTGECTSANGSHTLFYVSPQHYANHLQSDVCPKLAAAWEEKRDTRLIEIKRSNRKIF